MSDRLSPLDVSFLYMEEPTTPMHVGGVAIFEVPEGGFDYERLVRLIRDRIALVPRYRQRVRWVPGHLANPVWVDDEHFDVTYHVRRSALPRPGTDDQLNDLVARIMSRPLDRARPLWEMYLVEGLEDDRFAILTKTHHAMVDGIAAVDIGQVILDGSPEPREVPVDTWRPLREPSSVELVAGAVNEIARSPEGRRRHRADRPDRRPGDGRPARAQRRRAGRRRAHHGPPGELEPAERVHRRGPPLRDDRDRPGEAQADQARPRRDHQRHRAHHPRRGAAGVDAHAGRAGHDEQLDPGDGPGERAHAGGQLRQPDRGVPVRPADRRARSR